MHTLEVPAPSGTSMTPRTATLNSYLFCRLYTHYVTLNRRIMPKWMLTAHVVLSLILIISIVLHEKDTILLNSISMP